MLGLELTVACHAQQSVNLIYRRAPHDSVVVQRLEKIVAQQKHQTKEARRLRKTNDNDAESSSASGDEGAFDATECLKRYGLPSLDHGHFVPFDLLKRMVKSVQVARKSTKD